MNKKSSIIDSLLKEFENEEIILLLESQLETHQDNKTCYFTTKPTTWIKSINGIITVWDGYKTEEIKLSPWEALKQYRQQFKEDIYGYFGYNPVGNVQQRKTEEDQLPDMFFYTPEIAIRIRENNEIEWGNYSKYNSLKETEKDESSFSLKFTKSIHKRNYLTKIESVKKQIDKNNVQCVNLSHTLEYEFSGNPYHLFKAMRRIEPVPFAAYLKINNHFVCCSSPERFLKKENLNITTKPIKGTLKRDSKDINDHLNTFLNSDKEKNENKITVDLICDEFKTMAKPNTIKVTKLNELQTFKTLYHLVSTIECTAREDVNVIDIIKDNFPAASMVGVPRKNSMALISKLEEHNRGVYAGSVGYIKANDDFDFNVVIRSAVINNNSLEFSVGGAITKLSNAENEWDETIVKSRVLTSLCDVNG